MSSALGISGSLPKITHGRVSVLNWVTPEILPVSQMHLHRVQLWRGGKTLKAGIPPPPPPSPFAL